MARTKSEAIELLENRIRELQEENDELVNENEGLNERMSRIGALLAEDDEETDDDFSDDENDEDDEDE